MIIAQSGYEVPIICRNDYRNRTYSVDKLLAYAKAAGYNSILLLHTNWVHSREFYVVAYLDVVKDNNDIYLYDMSSGNTLFGGAYLGSGNVNYSQPMVSISDESDGLQSNGAWTFFSQSYQNRTYYIMSYNTYEPVFYTDMAYHNIYINNEKIDFNKSGGAGSGYIGNPLLSNKKMVGYNVPTSDATDTKTESVQVYSASGEENKPKAGNGMARITFLRSS